MNFRKKYSISCIDKYGDRFFDCKNDFIYFQNRNQRKQIINEFHIKNNNIWLPFEMYPKITLEEITNILGTPDVIDYDFNVFKYYDLLTMISFESVLNTKSTFTRITFTNSLKVKPTESELFEINEYWNKKIKKTINVNFGYNSKWIVFKTKKINDVLKKFKIDKNETSNWKEAFEISNIRGNGIFIFEAFNFIIINGWALPAIEKERTFYEALSGEFNSVFYFENHIKTPFSWAKLEAGKIERAFKEEYFENVLNIGNEIEIERSLISKVKQLKNIEGKYDSDQDIKEKYRIQMSEIVLKIAKKWCFNPIEIKKRDVKDKVYINRNYRQQCAKTIRG